MSIWTWGILQTFSMNCFWYWYPVNPVVSKSQDRIPHNFRTWSVMCGFNWMLIILMAYCTSSFWFKLFVVLPMAMSSFVRSCLRQIPRMLINSMFWCFCWSPYFSWSNPHGKWPKSCPWVVVESYTTLLGLSGILIEQGLDPFNKPVQGTTGWLNLIIVLLLPVVFSYIPSISP